MRKDKTFIFDCQGVKGFEGIEGIEVLKGPGLSSNVVCILDLLFCNHSLMAMISS